MNDEYSKREIDMLERQRYLEGVVIEQTSRAEVAEAEAKKLRDGLVAFRKYFTARHEAGYDADDIKALEAVRNALSCSVKGGEG